MTDHQWTPPRIRTREDVERYLDAERLVCLECGRAFAFLPTHLSRAHGMTAVQYRAAHRLPASTPLAGREYRAESAARVQRRQAEGDTRFGSGESASRASAAASEADRGRRPDWLRAEQAERMRRAAPRPQYAEGEARPDGRDAVRAREYQRARRALQRGDPEPMRLYKERYPA